MSLLGQTAPDFTLPGTDRKPVTLSGFRGSKVIIAFYPAAFTGVCEKEMCTFRDNLGQLNDAKAQVVGVSVDAPFSNGAFAGKFGLTFPLLSDYTRATTEAYGVAWPNFAGMAGYVAANRAVFIVDEAGTVIFEWIGANPGIEPDYAAVKAAVGA